MSSYLRRPRRKPVPVAITRAGSVPAEPRVKSGIDVAELMGRVQSVMRGWAGADDDRLTKGHWGSASSTSINQDLVTDLHTTRNRARWERQNNGILEGMVGTNALDVVGPQGPILQFLSDDKDYVKRAEAAWLEWWEMPDLNNQMSGPELLIQNVRSEWDNGESMAQVVNDPGAENVQMRLLTIHPRRVESPYGVGATDLLDITLGVRRTRTGRPLSYFVREDIDSEFRFATGYHFTEVPAANMLHDYQIQEPGQARGIPLLAACLQVVAQLRDWDRDVQQAMRMAAMLGMFFHTPHAGEEPIDFTGSVDLESGVGMALPPGWEPKQMQAQQPGQKYNDYRDAKLGEIGRPAGMPLMTVKLDSSGHNYSSARFDGQTYQRCVEYRQARMGRVTMNPILRRWRQEAELMGTLPRRPADLRHRWIWPKRPHVDPKKEADAFHQRLMDGTIDQDDMCAEYNLDVGMVRAKRVAAGLPAGPILSPSDGGRGQVTVGDEDEE